MAVFTTGLYNDGSMTVKALSWLYVRKEVVEVLRLLRGCFRNSALFSRSLRRGPVVSFSLVIGLCVDYDVRNLPIVTVAD